MATLIFSCKVRVRLSAGRIQQTTIFRFLLVLLLIRTRLGCTKVARGGNGDVVATGVRITKVVRARIAVIATRRRALGALDSRNSDAGIRSVCQDADGEVSGALLKTEMQQSAVRTNVDDS